MMMNSQKKRSTGILTAVLCGILSCSLLAGCSVQGGGSSVGGSSAEAESTGEEQSVELMLEITDPE